MPDCLLIAAGLGSSSVHIFGHSRLLKHLKERVAPCSVWAERLAETL